VNWNTSVYTSDGIGSIFFYGTTFCLFDTVYSLHGITTFDDMSSAIPSRNWYYSGSSAYTIFVYAYVDGTDIYFSDYTYGSGNTTIKKINGLPTYHDWYASTTTITNSYNEWLPSSYAIGNGLYITYDESSNILSNAIDPHIPPTFTLYIGTFFNKKDNKFYTSVIDSNDFIVKTYSSPDLSTWTNVTSSITGITINSYTSVGEP